MFRVGQKVVCIDASHSNGELTLHAVYTISDIRVFDPTESSFNGTGLILAEVHSPETDTHWAHWRADRFRPAVDRKTDISVFTAILNPNKQKVDA